MKILAQTEQMIAIDAAGGRYTVNQIAGTLSLDAASLLPLDALDSGCDGIHALARTPVVVDEFVAALASGEATREYRAISPVPIWSDGVFEESFRSAPAATRFEVLETRGSQSELALFPGSGGAAQIRFHLARAGLPIAGDTRRGGDPTDGGLRLRCARLAIPAWGIDLEAKEPSDFWFVKASPNHENEPATLIVSRATGIALERGHPWILPDADTSDVESFRPGTLVQVRSIQGKRHGHARIEGNGRIAARVWANSQSRKRGASVEARVASALDERRALLEDATTDAVRLIHGEADGLPGLFVDRFGPALRVLLTSRACAPLIDRVGDALVRGLGASAEPPPAIVRVVHLGDAPAGRLRCVQEIRGSLSGATDADGRVVVRERGLRFAVNLGLEAPYRPRPGTGLFLDQRENRTRIVRRASGGRWLNLFCHTGAFSVAALAGGASEVVSVDLSAPYLRWLDENLALNEIDPAPHRGVRMDARRYLERLAPKDLFDGIICDPPTAARAGKRFWSVRRGGGELVAACLQHLRPGGALLLCRNDRAARGTLAPLVREVATHEHIDLAGIETAPPGLDFPRMAPFPEGDAFDGVFATRT